jgi:hypothetical protein
MAIERPPDRSVGDLSVLRRYRPPADTVAKYHQVAAAGRETLETVARANGISVKELIAFNFPGTVVGNQIAPPVVNWYLGHHEEFRCPETHDRSNRVFKGGERLAIPLRTTYIEFEDPLVVVGQAPVPNLWFGGGYKAGTTFGVVGIETAQIVCVRSDGKAGFTATVSGTRFPAVGIGASGGPIIVLITSMNSPGQLSSLMTGGKDFSLAVGGKFDAFLANPRTARAMKALARFAETHGKAGQAGLRAGKGLVQYNGQILDAVRLLEMDLGAPEPQVFTMGSPWGGFGAEVSVHFTVSKFHLEATM